MRSLELLDVAALEYEERDGLWVADLAIPGCYARLVRYEAGTQIPLHYHTRRSVKVLVRGSMRFAPQDGCTTDVDDGTIYFCDGVIYRGEALSDAYLLVIDEAGSERVNVDEAAA